MCIKYWMIQIEGVDKTCKDLLCEYLKQISDFRFTPYSRGIVSLMAYTEKYKRGYEYSISDCLTKNCVFVYLKSDLKEIEIRHKIAKEQNEVTQEDIELFDKYIQKVEDEGYIVFKYNTSEQSIYKIAKNIVDRLMCMQVMEEKTYAQ